MYLIMSVMVRKNELTLINFATYIALVRNAMKSDLPLVLSITNGILQ